MANCLQFLLILTETAMEQLQVGLSPADITLVSQLAGAINCQPIFWWLADMLKNNPDDAELVNAIRSGCSPIVWAWLSKWRTEVTTRNPQEEMRRCLQQAGITLAQLLFMMAYIAKMNNIPNNFTCTFRKPVKMAAQVDVRVSAFRQYNGGVRKPERNAVSAILMLAGAGGGK